MEYNDTILIVDDSEVILKVLGAKITKAGYTILSANDGGHALSLLDGRPIDLIITDLNMPGINGLQLIKQIRSMQDYYYVPTILFIEDSHENRREILQTSGATMLFDKSNIKENLIGTIKKCL